MASVEAPPRPRQTKRASRSTKPKPPRRRARTALAHTQAPPTRPRTPTSDAVRAKDAFATLSLYFSRTSQLRKALGWSEPTIRSWQGAAPARPRTEHVQRVLHLLEVAHAAHEWVHDDIHRVGEWLLAPNEAMAGLQPAAIVRKLGANGVKSLLDGMYRIAPRTRSYEGLDLSPEQLLKALAGLGLTRPRGAPRVDVDLSDFEG